MPTEHPGRCMARRLLLLFWAIAAAALATMPNAAMAQGLFKKVTDNIFMAVGTSNIASNTYIVLTSEGAVIIDTSSPEVAPQHYNLLRPLTNAPIKYIILTHAHGDHTGGISLWKQEGTTVVAQSNIVEFLHYQTRLRGFLAPRNAAQAGKPPPDVQNPNPGNYMAQIPADTLFDKEYTFKLGGLTFKLYSTPGETPDHLTVWIPEMKAAFVGDNFYGSFPNIYTLRGTKPRWALDYVRTLNTVLAWNPVLVLPSHGDPIKSTPTISQKLTQYRDAILHVHDSVVAGMDAGVDVFTLMDTVKLPPNLDVGEAYGRVSWSVRGIYEGYTGWFDTDPVNMYSKPARSALPELVAMTSGVATVVQRARNVLNAGNPVLALHLANAAIAADDDFKEAWNVRRDALSLLKSQSNNGIEKNWLQDGINKADSELAK